MGTDSYADVVERLFREFDWALPLPEIAKVVSECRQHWSGPSELEGLENEARRLLSGLSLVPRSEPTSGFSLRGPWATQATNVGQTSLAPA